MERHNPSADYIMIKKATRDLVTACGGLIAASQICRVGKTTLQKYYDPRQPDFFVPLDVVFDLEQACGENIIARALSNGAASKPDIEFADHLLKSIKEFGEVASAIHDMNADGRQTAVELRKVAEEAEDAIRILQEIRDAANGRLPSPLRSAS